MNSLVLPSPAKLNLFLHILGRRPDGYHVLQTLFQFLNYGDTLTLTARTDGRIVLEQPLPGVPDEENLIDNGLKYTPRHGSVRAILSSKEDQATIRIEDNGIGIPEEYLDRIFERFFRVDKARSREIGGTGLGLAIVKNICLKHDGNVEVESKDGKGTTFTITLPLHSDSE